MFYLTAITAAITSASAGTGIAIYDLSTLPEAGYGRSCPMLIPSGGLTFGTQLGRLTMGNRTAAWKASRALVYNYLHVPVGEGRTIADFLPAMAANQDALFNALTGAAYPAGVQLDFIECSEFQGDVPDPLNNPHLGFIVTLRFTEFK